MASWHSVLDALCIRVVVCPLGDISPAQFDLYLQLLLLHHAAIDLRLLSPPSHRAPATEKSVFSRQAGTPSTMHFDFIQEKDYSEDMKEFDTFQMYRRVFAAIGIGMHGASPSPPQKTSPAHSELLDRTRALDGCGVVRCFLFAPSSDSDSDTHASPNLADPNAAIIPDKDPHKTAAHVRTLMCEFAAALLCHFETIATDLSAVPEILSPRSLDAKGPEKGKKAKGRTGGRLAKLLGDLYLLSGAYSDAVNSLVVASEETKSSGDLVWNAAAQEALQIALVIQSERVLVDQKETAQALWIALPEKLREIAILYKKTEIPLLSFEVYKTIASLLNFAESPSEAAMALCQGWSIHRALAFSDKLYVLTWIIRKFTSLTMPRKSAFFLQILSSILSAEGETSMAFMILLKTFSVYSIHLQVLSHGGWLALKVSILRKASLLAEHHKDRRLMVEYNCALLAYAQRHLSADEQARIAKGLCNFQRQEASNFYPAGDLKPSLFPLLDTLSFDRDAAHLWRKTTFSPTAANPATSNSGTFIYMPLPANAASTTKIAIAVNDTFSATLQISNPFNFSIDLVALKLLSDTVPIEAEEVVVTLPAYTKKKTVMLMCNCIAVGQLCITRLQATIFGLPTILTVCEAGAPLRISVIAEHPILKVKDSFAMSEHVALVHGQRVPLTLRLANFGPVPASFLRVSFESSSTEESHSSAECIEAVLFSLPSQPIELLEKVPAVVQPGEDISLCFTVRGHLGWYAPTFAKSHITRLGSKIVIEYGLALGDGNDKDSHDNGGQYIRRLEYTLKATVRPSLRVKAIRALPYQFVGLETGVEGSGTEDSPTLAAVVPDSDDATPAAGLATNLPEYKLCLMSVDVENLLEQNVSVQIVADGGTCS